MSTTIDSLDIQIQASAGSAAADIDKLAANLRLAVTVTNRMAKASQNASSAQSSHNARLNAQSINLAASITNLRVYIDSCAGLFYTRLGRILTVGALSA